MKKLLNLLGTYPALTAQEKADQSLMMSFIAANPDALSRSNLAGHVTSSIIILNQAQDKILLGYHHIYQSWGWFGGHNDGDDDCYRVARKEAFEETALAGFIDLKNDVLALDVIYLKNHIKAQQYIPDHLHLNVTYGFIADEQASLKINPDEHEALRWFPLTSYLDYVREPRMKSIYEKIVKRMQERSN